MVMEIQKKDYESKVEECEVGMCDEGNFKKSELYPGFNFSQI